MNLLRHKADTGLSGHKAENIRLQLLRVFVAYIPGYSRVIRIRLTPAGRDSCSLSCFKDLHLKHFDPPFLLGYF